MFDLDSFYREAFSDLAWMFGDEPEPDDQTPAGFVVVRRDETADVTNLVMMAFGAEQIMAMPASTVARYTQERLPQ